MTLRDYVNTSGFPLQLAVAHYVRNSQSGWRVLYEEHEWRSEEERGFMDLVLEDQYKTWLMNVECKRVRDTDWIFLIDRNAHQPRRHARLWVTRFQDSESLMHFDWVDVPMDPSSPESAYCIVPGQDARSRPMLERVAATLVDSTEALAAEEAKNLSPTYSELRIYQNVIVTTARLHICIVAPDKIDMRSGDIDENSEFTEVPYARFRKQLGGKFPAAQRTTEPRTDAKSRESTVFVVNSSRFGEFLDNCDLPNDLQRYIRG